MIVESFYEGRSSTFGSACAEAPGVGYGFTHRTRALSAKTSSY